MTSSTIYCEETKVVLENLGCVHIEHIKPISLKPNLLNMLHSSTLNITMLTMRDGLC